MNSALLLAAVALVSAPEAGPMAPACDTPAIFYEGFTPTPDMDDRMLSTVSGAPLFCKGRYRNLHMCAQQLLIKGKKQEDGTLHFNVTVECAPPKRVTGND